MLIVIYQYINFYGKKFANIKIFIYLCIVILKY